MGVHEPSDGMAEEVERQIQLAISAAALAARRLINSRQAALAAAAAQSEARTRQLRAQFERERSVASSHIQPVFDDAWWDAAQPRDVGEMWERAEQWRQPDAPDGQGTVFDRAAERIQQEAQERWRLDAGAIAALAYADDAAEHDRLAALDAAQPTVDDGSRSRCPRPASATTRGNVETDYKRGWALRMFPAKRSMRRSSLTPRRPVQRPRPSGQTARRSASRPDPGPGAQSANVTEPAKHS